MFNVKEPAAKCGEATYITSKGTTDQLPIKVKLHFTNQLPQFLDIAASFCNSRLDPICDRIWEKVHYRAYYQNQVIGTTG